MRTQQNIGDPADESAARDVIARLDRLGSWPLPYAYLIIIGIGFLFTFFDIFDINVSFIQTCIALRPGCTPQTALSSLSLPVFLNVVGYVVGTLILSPISDRIGRRNMLLITMLITAAGSLYTALTPDYTNFIIARILTGVGIGADLAVVNTYIGEIAPSKSRARFTSIIFINSALGAFFAIWLGLLLTQPSSPWPTGLPFALASKTFSDGWRYLYGIGALLAVIGVFIRFELPESPRWLVGQGKIDKAKAIVQKMESVVERRGETLAPVLPSVAIESKQVAKNPYSEIFSNPLYVRRFIIMVLTWLIGYVTVYSFAAGFTSVLTSIHYPPPEAGVIVAVGTIGFIVGCIITSTWGDSIERKYWLPISAVITLIGGILIATAGTDLTISFIGSGVVFLGFNLWVSPTYALSAECFPSRARTTGFGLVDGFGHIGGGIGILVIAPLVPKMSPTGALLLICAFLIVAAVIVQLSPATKGKDLEEVSP
ncbi:MAG: MFS transporter [Nitrososphaerota archaeon]|jgi:MFS family permease|nr:MFS transporter [Nitrososphaerota archaeon]